MPYEKAINVLQGGAVMAECGPMRLVISAFVGKIHQPEMSMRAAKESFKYLEQVARLRGMLGQRFSELPDDLDDSLAIKMIRNILAVGDEDLTPMAAVAGTIGDAVADFLFNLFSLSRRRTLAQPYLTRAFSALIPLVISGISPGSLITLSKISLLSVSFWLISWSRSDGDTADLRLSHL